MLPQKEEGEIEAAKIRPDLGAVGWERVYVLLSVVDTCPTSQVDRLPLKTPAPINTAPHTSTKKSPMIKKI